MASMGFAAFHGEGGLAAGAEVYSQQFVVGFTPLGMIVAVALLFAIANEISA